MADNPPVQRKATWRMGARQRERLQWGVVGLICLLLFFALRPYYYHIIEVRDLQTCQSNMLQIARGVGLYADDFDGGVPLGANWTDSVGGYLATRSGTGFHVEDLFHCPKDKSGAKSSYVWNDVFDGYSSVHKNKDEAKDAALLKIAPPVRIPLVIERHGSGLNAHTRVTDWDGLAREETLAHEMPQPTGSLIFGSLKPSTVSKEKLEIRAGTKF